MTSTKKIKATAFDPKHPYRTHYEKTINRDGIKRIVNDFRKGTHSYSVALFLAIFLIVPITFIPPGYLSKSFVVPTTFTEKDLVFPDLISGKGGPEESLVERAEYETISFKENQTLDVFSLQNENAFPIVTFTKTFNHLKVANTVMPTESSQSSSGYGWRTPPCSGCSADHKGVDFVPGAGKPIFAVADGMVIDMGNNGGYGNFVRLKHLMSNSEGVIEEWETLYAHMKNESFPEGMMIGSVVKSGDTIGAVGNTGVSTGPHLHFELLINGEHVDPLPLLGTYKIIIVSEDEYEDYMFVGENFKTVEKIITYE